MSSAANDFAILKFSDLSFSNFILCVLRNSKYLVRIRDAFKMMLIFRDDVNICLARFVACPMYKKHV